ncbi:MAG: aldo/keto reductase [Theionarchaea archaeon]|nr:aldo/keto reductase [Theionarchaea archaeon]
MQNISLPRIGLGTWENTNPSKCAMSVSTAITIGYRLIDTAQAYRNENHVGKGIAQADIPREHITVCTKVWISNLSHHKVLDSTEKSLKKLGLDVIDILYIHWPAHPYDAEKTLRAFSELKDQGKITHIAVSNFTIPLLEEALEICDNPIIANQVEMHPLLKQKEMVQFLKNQNMYLIAYSPLARGHVFNIPELTEIAQKHGVSEAQVSLAWLMTHENVIPIPKATSKQHIEDNFKALQLTLDQNDIEKIESIAIEKRTVNPPFAPW